MRPQSRPSRRRPARRRAARPGPAAWLAESERLFRDFVELTPYPFQPFVRTFTSWDEYERWRHAQTNPWYR
jgi:hypothetical protein